VIDSSKFLFGYQPHVKYLGEGSGGLNVFMNCANVYINASNLKLRGNKGYFGGNVQFFFKLFTNVSVTLEDSNLDAGQASRGAGVFVAIDQDTAVNDEDSCSHRSLHFWNHHQLMYLSNVTFQGNVARTTGADFEMEDHMEPGHSVGCDGRLSLRWKHHH